jgi:hypothetical protein
MLEQPLLLDPFSVDILPDLDIPPAYPSYDSSTFYENSISMPHMYNFQPEVPIASHNTIPLGFSDSQTSQTTSDGSDSEGSSSVTSTRDNYFPCNWKDPKEPNMPKCQKICSSREKLR